MSLYKKIHATTGTTQLIYTCDKHKAVFCYRPELKLFIHAPAADQDYYHPHHADPYYHNLYYEPSFTYIHVTTDQALELMRDAPRYDTRYAIYQEALERQRTLAGTSHKALTPAEVGIYSVSGSPRMRTSSDLARLATARSHDGKSVIVARYSIGTHPETIRTATKSWTSWVNKHHLNTYTVTSTVDKNGDTLVSDM